MNHKVYVLTLACSFAVAAHAMKIGLQDDKVVLETQFGNIIHPFFTDSIIQKNIASIMENPQQHRAEFERVSESFARSEDMLAISLLHDAVGNNAQGTLFFNIAQARPEGYNPWMHYYKNLQEGFWNYDGPVDDTVHNHLMEVVGIKQGKTHPLLAWCDKSWCNRSFGAMACMLSQSAQEQNKNALAHAWLRGFIEHSFFSAYTHSIQADALNNYAVLLWNKDKERDATVIVPYLRRAQEMGSAYAANNLALIASIKKQPALAADPSVQQPVAAIVDTSAKEVVTTVVVAESEPTRAAPQPAKPVERTLNDEEFPALPKVSSKANHDADKPSPIQVEPAIRQAAPPKTIVTTQPQSQPQSKTLADRGPQSKQAAKKDSTHTPKRAATPKESEVAPSALNPTSIASASTSTSSVQHVAPVVSGDIVAPTNTAVVQPVKKDYTTCTYKELRKAKATIIEAFRCTTNHVPLYTERTEIYNALLARAKDDSQRIPLWGEMSEFDTNAQYQLGALYLKSNNDSSRIQKGLALLKSAADGNHGDACYMVIKWGFESQDPSKKADAALYLDRLLNDPLRVAQIAWNDVKKSVVYAHRAQYAMLDGNRKTAHQFFEKASELGNNEHACTFGDLCVEKNDFNQAKKQFALVTGERESYAAWMSDVLACATTKDKNEKACLLEEISKPMRNVKIKDRILPDSEISNAVLQSRVLQSLTADCENDQHANFIRGYCAEKGWGTQDGKPDYSLAYTHFRKAFELGDNESFKQECVYALRRFHEAHPETYEYVLLHFPTEKQLRDQKKAKELQEEVARLYAQLDTDTQEVTVSAAAIESLEKEVKNNGKNAAKAHRLLGLDRFDRGLEKAKLADKADKKAKDKHIADMNREHCAAIDHYERATALGYPQGDLMCGEMLYRMAKFVEDKEKKLNFIMRASEKGYPRAHLSLYHYYLNEGKEEQGEPYLQKAYEAQLPGARIIYAQKNLEKDVSESQKLVDGLLSEFANDPKALSPDEINELYVLKSDLCERNEDLQGHIEWRKKAFDNGHHEEGFDLAIAYLNVGEHRNADDVLNTMDTKGYKPHYKYVHAMIKTLVNYHLSPDDANVKNEFLKSYECYLNRVAFKVDAVIESLDGCLRKTFAKDIASRTSDVEQRIRSLLLYREGEAVEAYEIAKATNNRFIMAELLFTGIEGVVAPDHQKALEELIKSILTQPCTSCRSHERSHLYKKLIRNEQESQQGLAQKFIVNEELALGMNILFKDLRSQPQVSKEEAALLTIIPLYMCEFYNACRNVELLTVWCGRLKQCNPDEWAKNAPYYEVKMAAEREENLMKRHAMYVNIAKNGDPRAQIDALTVCVQAERRRYAGFTDQEVAVLKAFGNRWIEALLINPAASKKQKTIVYVRRGTQVADLMLKTNDVDQKKEMYEKVLRDYEAAFQEGCEEAIVLCITLHAEAGHQDEARELYHKYRDTLKIWNSCAAYLFASNLLSADVSYAKEVCSKMVDITFKIKISAQDDIESIGRDLDALEKLCDSIMEQAEQDPVRYGFENEQDVRVVSMSIARALPRVRMNLANSRLAQERMGAASTLIDMFTKRR